MSEFELVWLFLEALNPRVRPELERKNVETLNKATRLAKVYNKGLVVYYARQRTEKLYPRNGNGHRYKNGYDRDYNVNHQAETQNKTSYVLGARNLAIELLSAKSESKTEYVDTFDSGSGCTSSVISSRFVKKTGITLNDLEIKIKSADNRVAIFDGKTESLRVDKEVNF
ncbi:unnamed protein product [Brachionus calyciflorus]|uniref:Uncharacterized protein n=1 Tax=Brachionus calyciflorus TaxID=104777 RepID=A0A814A471_9BILA|nr:unnamed protein product [Brachionus calyciflorus]